MEITVLKLFVFVMSRIVFIGNGSVVDYFDEPESNTKKALCSADNLE